jgi:iron complex outermembrane receptor protein
VSLVDPDNGQPYIANGSAAKSQGVELSLQYKLPTHTTISAWATWQDAVLTADFPLHSAIQGLSGDRLPYSSRFSSNVSAEQNFPLADRATLFVGGMVSYVGARLDVFTSTPQRQDLPAYTKTDFRGGLRYEDWTANVFVSNAFDRRGVISGGEGNFPPFGFLYIQPRTVGLSVARVF